MSVSNGYGSVASNTATVSVTFTDAHSPDHTLTTIVQAAHIVEWRNRISAVRVAHALPSLTWAKTLTAQITLIKASQVNELRTQILALYAALGLPTPTFLYSPTRSGTSCLLGRSRNSETW